MTRFAVALLLGCAPTMSATVRCQGLTHRYGRPCWCAWPAVRPRPPRIAPAHRLRPPGDRRSSLCERGDVSELPVLADSHESRGMPPDPSVPRGVHVGLGDRLGLDGDDAQRGS
jgi:hypothetical protein